MVLCGILPIDQMRDHVGPVNLMASRISRQLLNAYYGIRIEEPPSHCANPERPPTSGFTIFNSSRAGFPKVGQVGPLGTMRL